MSRVPAEGRLMVAFIGDRDVRADGTVVGSTNQLIHLPAGHHVIDLAEPRDYEPTSIEIELGPGEVQGLMFKTPTPPVDRFDSPLSCRYNGFMLGQFMMLSFVGFAADGYDIRRARIHEFLAATDIEVELPSDPPAFGSDEHLRLAQRMLTPLHQHSPVLADFCAIGASALTYGYTAWDENQDAEQSLSVVRRLCDENGVSPACIDRFEAAVPRDCEEPPPASAVLSPSLDLLADFLRELEPEPDTAFVAMPFSGPTEHHFGVFYRPALEGTGRRAIRAWGGLAWEDYCDVVQVLIAKSGMVLADVSGRNPNVLYEVGAAHALGKLTVLVGDTTDIEHVPANIGHDAVMTYSTAEDDWPDEAIGRVAMVISVYELAAGPEPEHRVTHDELVDAFRFVGRRLTERLGYTDADSYMTRGRTRAAEGDLAGAEADFTAAIELGCDDSEVYARRGRLRYRAEDWSGAIEDFTAAIELGGDDALVRSGRGVARLMSGDVAGAEVDLSAVIGSEDSGSESSTPGGVDRDITTELAEPGDEGEFGEGARRAAWFLRGTARLALRRFEGCRADLTRASEEGLTLSGVHSGLAAACARLGLVDDASAALASLDVEDEAWHRCAGDVALASGEFDGAVAEYEAAAAAETRSPGQWFSLGLALLFAHRQAAAEAAYRAGIAESTSDERIEALAELGLWTGMHPDAADPDGRAIVEDVLRR